MVSAEDEHKKPDLVYVMNFDWENCIYDYDSSKV